MTEKKVVSLTGQHTPATEPVEDVVRKIEEFLVKAKSGEIRSVAIAAVTEDQRTLTVYDSENQIFQLMGAISYLSTRIGMAIESSS